MDKTLSQELFNFLFKKINLSDGKEYYLYALPDTKASDVDVFWLVPNAENIADRNFTREPRYLDTFTLNYRSTDKSDADIQISRVKEIINSLKCFSLPHYEVLDIQATFINVDDDLDVEKAKRASLTINLTTYNERKENESS